MKDYLISLTSYNTWANTKILNFISAAGEDRNTMEQVSSFPTIRQTLMHILDAQTIWYSRLHSISPVVWPGQNFTGTTPDAGNLLVESSREFEAYVSGLTDDALASLITYKNIKGEQFQNSIMNILVHVMNHGTFHRGQLVTMLRASGFTDLSSTDMITWFRVTAK